MPFNGSIDDGNSANAIEWLLHAVVSKQIKL